METSSFCQQADFVAAILLDFWTQTTRRQQIRHEHERTYQEEVIIYLMMRNIRILHRFSHNRLWRVS